MRTELGGCMSATGRFHPLHIGKRKGPRIAPRPHLFSPDGPDQSSEDPGILFVADEAHLADAPALDHPPDIVHDATPRIGLALALPLGPARHRPALSPPLRPLPQLHRPSVPRAPPRRLHHP